MICKTRKRRIHLILIFALVTVFALSAVTVSPPSYAINFTDTDNHWAKSYIDVISTYGVVTGYTDGTFKPNSYIQRIEFIAIVINAQGLTVRSPEPDEYWGQPYIDAAIENGLIMSNAYETMDASTFSIDITREEMASIIVNSAIQSGITPDSLALEEARNQLSDFDTVSPQYYENAVASVALDFISGYSNGTFAPKQNATRAQATVLSYKLLVKQGTIANDDLPENIVLSKLSLQQGELLKMAIYHTDSASEIALVQDLYPALIWSNHDDVIEGVIPTNYSTALGVYNLSFTNTMTGKQTNKSIEITPRNFRVQNLTVDAGTESSTRTDDAYDEYYKYFNPSREISSPVKLYTESFILPTHGKLTTEFGEARVVNGALTSYRHAGIDIAASRGTNVVATNSGKVMLSMQLVLTGNSIVIDHGEGLFSVYFHLDKRHVAEGEMVMRGELIGEVGSTGFSTGPHLHFTMSYYRFNVEPGYFLYGQSLTKANYLYLMK